MVEGLFGDLTMDAGAEFGLCWDIREILTRCFIMNIHRCIAGSVLALGLSVAGGGAALASTFYPAEG